MQGHQLIYQPRHIKENRRMNDIKVVFIPCLHELHEVFMLLFETRAAVF